jgi:hypothetical protein
MRNEFSPPDLDIMSRAYEIAWQHVEKRERLTPELSNEARCAIVSGIVEMAAKGERRHLCLANAGLAKYSEELRRREILVA